MQASLAAVGGRVPGVGFGREVGVEDSADRVEDRQGRASRERERANHVAREAESQRLGVVLVNLGEGSE